MRDPAEHLLQRPSFKAALDEPDVTRRPRVTFKDGRGHRLIEVTVVQDPALNLVELSEHGGGAVFDGLANLLAVPKDAVGHPESADYDGRADPTVGRASAIRQPRVGFKCEEPGCPYAPVMKKVSLLERYADALAQGKGSITLRG